tara:strand:+ start:2063 stop:3118 length:1056 start_codon:yes stop_codon:yes gene_type:complete
VAEFSLKLMAPQKCYAYPKGMFVEDELLCHELSKDYEGSIKTAEFSINIKTNSQGLRDSEYSYEKPADTTRILGLGDSFQFGVGVEGEEVYLNVLEQNLNKNSNGKYEVMNMGVLGYGLDQQQKYFNEEGKKYNPDIVILSFYQNDVVRKLSDSCDWFVRDGYLVDDYTAAQTALSFKAKLFLNRKSDLYCMTKNTALQLAPVIRTKTVTIDAEATVLPYLEKTEREDVNEWLELTFDAIRKLKEDVEKEGAQFWIVMIPDQLQVDNELWQDIIKKTAVNPEDYDFGKFSKTMREFADKERIKLVDPLPEFKEEGKSRKLYYPIEAHWNKEGHALAAEIVEKEIMQSETES